MMRVIMTVLVLAIIACCAYVTESIQVTIRNEKNGRVDMIEKKLKGIDLTTGSPVTEEVKNHVKKSCAPGDVIGIVLDETLGGLGNETYNALPMNPSVLEIWKTKVIDPTFRYLMANKSVVLSFMCVPFYEKASSTRPYGLGVFVTEVSTNSNAFVVKAYIPNPPEAISNTVTPFIYRTGNVFTVERKNESFDIIEVGGESPRERVEMATKVVHLSDLTTGTEIDEFTRNYTQSLADNKLYVPGLLLSQKLGGKGDDPYNAVPMDPKAAKEFETKVEIPTLAFFQKPFNKYKTVILVVMVMYADETSTRPVGFIVLSRQTPNYSIMYIPNQGYIK